MPDGLNTYKSTLTGPELDEALRNIGNVQANIEKAAGYAETAEQYGTIVEQNQTAIQAIEDNLPAVQGAAANAQSAAANAQAAAQSAQEAQTAAQQALGFRTFFSAVSPDENGDLDPSRPMTTPTAQASWTIKSKGDRIQSVQVNGFTTQAGTGDPSPDNVREISTAGIKMVEYTLTGEESYTRFDNWKTGSWRVLNLLNGALPIASNTDIPLLFCNLYTTTNANNIATQGHIGVSQGVSTTLYLNLGAEYSTTGLIKAKIKGLFDAGTPIKIWAAAESEETATGLYIPIQSQGHEYRCQCIPLTAPLCAGDTVESCVPSGCDKTLVLDGSQSLTWNSSSESPYGGWFSVSASDVPAPVSGVVPQILSDQFFAVRSVASLFVSGIVSNASGSKIVFTLFGQKSVEDANAYLAQNPIAIWYRSTNYTEANDIPVALEEHQQAVLVLTGTEKDLLFAATGLQTEPVLPFYINNINRRAAPKCSHYAPKNTGIPIPDNSLYFFDTYFGRRLAIRDSSWSSLEDAKSYLASQYAAGTPVTVVYKLSAPAIYAHDPVDLVPVPVPYTEEDATAAQQLANTPSTLPYIDSADIPMLLNKTTEAEPAAESEPAAEAATETDAEGTTSTEVPPADATNAVQPMTMPAPLSTALPVAGTYVVSSQNGTTVQVSLKSMQDGGDAATLEGMTLDDIKALISSMIADANK